MHELEKIEEAEYFYSQMVKEKENTDNFKHNLSAFLSATRSVLQYALKEAETKSGGQKWYDSQVANNKVVSFFKDKRDINIHLKPVLFRKDIAIKLSETIHIGESVSIVIRDKDGNIKGKSHSEFKPFQSAIDKGTIESKYTFDDWSGEEDIPFICQEYLKELKAIVEDGKNNLFLT